MAESEFLRCISVDWHVSFVRKVSELQRNPSHKCPSYRDTPLFPVRTPILQQPLHTSQESQLALHIFYVNPFLLNREDRCKVDASCGRPNRPVLCVLSLYLRMRNFRGTDTSFLGRRSCRCAGVHATIDRSAIDARTPALPGSQDVFAMLRLTAGSAPRVMVIYAVTITISYWSDACQPKPGAVIALTNPQNQAVGRSFKVTLNIAVLPHVAITSLASSTLDPSIPPSMPPADNNSSTDRTAAKPTSCSSPESTCIYVSVSRSGARALCCELCFCEVSALERMLNAIGTGGSVDAAYTQLRNSHKVAVLSEAAGACDLWLALKKFDTRDMYSVARGGKPQVRKSFAEQLRQAARFFATSVAVVWRLDVSMEQIVREAADNPGGVSSLGFVTIPEQVRFTSSE